MWEIKKGDALNVLKAMPNQSINTCITSPPYWGLRDYGVNGQLGLEPTPEEYVANLVEVFREVRRVLRDDGTLWLNLGDSYASVHTGGQKSPKSTVGSNMPGVQEIRQPKANPQEYGLKDKDLVGIPWRVAFALQADGWYLRSDIVWHKPNAMPESVTDRPTKAHEYIFLLSKSRQYYYDHELIKEPSKHAGAFAKNDGVRGMCPGYDGHRTRAGLGKGMIVPDKRNKRSVWTVPTRPFPEAHFATFPPKLIEPCILAGCPKGGVVLDPFCGSGTTLLVATENHRKSIGIELNPDYIEIAKKRLGAIQLRLVMGDA